VTKIGDTIELRKGMCSVDLMGHPCGKYPVRVGNYGWDDGDLYIQTTKGKLKLIWLKDMGDI